jgi:invasion protein IalB
MFMDRLTAMSRFLTTICIAFAWAAGAFASGAAFAQNPKPIARYGDWQALTFQEDDKSGCYVIAEPVRKEGAYTSRGKVYALVTHRPADRKLDVITIIAGYTYEENSKVTLEIGSDSYELDTQDDMAWASDEDDPRIVESLKKGEGMVVRGISSRGTETVDTYSLIGFSKAYAAIGEACGVKQ